MAGFGLPNFSQLTEAFQKAQQIQKDAVRLQEELDALVLEGFSGDRRVRSTISG
ncbi:MAG: YbaB/EbfC family nucleoid-associated protein, partial [Synechococcus sp. SB0665_bin_28]|nr:YbaB/EbfC family nucleoid-associated protein [Synechococcus sp. SB0665_bin_28]